MSDSSYEHITMLSASYASEMNVWLSSKICWIEIEDAEIVQDSH